jgi:hypothetical protein
LAFRTHLLVVANQTADSPELIAALHERSEQSPIHVTLLVPCTYSERAEANARIQAAKQGLADTGIEAEGLLGDADPIVAVQETWHPGRYDEVVVSTLEEGASRWLQFDLPHRVAKLTDCTVRHVAVPVRPATPKAHEPPPAPKPLLESALGLLRSATRGEKA